MKVYIVNSFLYVATRLITYNLRIRSVDYSNKYNFVM